MSEDAFGRSGPFQPIETAPKDGSLIIGREADGSLNLMRWRSKARMVEEDGPDDQGPAPYWGRWRTDTGLNPTEWAPTSLTEEETLDWV